MTRMQWSIKRFVGYIARSTSRFICDFKTSLFISQTELLRNKSPSVAVHGYIQRHLQSAQSFEMNILRIKTKVQADLFLFLFQFISRLRSAAHIEMRMMDLK